MHVGDQARFANQTVANCCASVGAEFVIAAVSRDGTGIVPSGNTVVMPGDALSVVAFSNDRETIFRLIGQHKARPSKVAVVGGSKIARFLLRNFDANRLKGFILVEQDKQVCERMAMLFPTLLVLHSDITDEAIFSEERLDSCDLLISLTDNDELNIITASYAKRVGVRNSIALIKNNNNYVLLAVHLGIDSVISVTEATVDSLLKYLRGEHVKSVHSLYGGHFEIFEFEITAAMGVAGRQLKDINMRGKGIIAGITRPTGENVIPTGAYRIGAGDVLLACASRKELAFIQKIFS